VVEAAKEKAAELGIDGKGTTKRHVLLCCDQTKPKCCKKEIADQSWEYLKRRLKETNLVGSGGVFRTKANCLQVCMAGPVAVVYPEGVWYHSCNESVHRTEHTNKSFFEAVHVIGLVNLLRR
jgi:NADH:ubiquinone oxidoreductase subunit E